MLAMVIDDSRAMRSILRRIVTELGFDCVEAANGQEALDIMNGGSLPDVALVDWNMPVLDGLSYVSAVRGNRDWRDVSLMMVTTEGEHAQVVRALAAGAHEYVIKPFTPDAIQEKLQILGLVGVEA
jgi:two-component system chemotaxis response regulator CheY